MAQNLPSAQVEVYTVTEENSFAQCHSFSMLRSTTDHGTHDEYIIQGHSYH